MPGNWASHCDESVWESRELKLSVYHRETEDAFSYNFTMKHNQEGLQNFYSKAAMPVSSLEEKETKHAHDSGQGVSTLDAEKVKTITTIQKKQLSC